MERVREIARFMADTRSVLFLGRHVGFPVALEGALKLKELAYIHAEGFAAGELKHGPIALIDPGVEPFADVVIRVPQCSPLLAPLLTVVPLQVFACELATAKGLDVDQPRN